MGYTVELHIPGLIGTASHPDMQKIRIIGFFFENRLHWQFEVGEKISTYSCFMLHIYLRVNVTPIHNSLYVFDHSGKHLSHKRCSTFTVKKCLPKGPSRSG